MRKNHHSLKLILSDDVSSPVFILVRPQMAENIGMAARAMMNCGLWRMRLVSPKENHLDERAINASSGADEILKRAEVFSDLSDALSDLQYVVATTARVRGMEKDVLSAEDMMKNIKNQHLDISSVGIMFGCERTGLENDELALADSLLTVPLNALHPSLNLSQAVLLTAYEYMKCFSNIKNLFHKYRHPPIPLQTALLQSTRNLQSQSHHRGQRHSSHTRRIQDNVPKRTPSHHHPCLQ